MAQPTPSDAHVDARLTDISEAFVQSEDSFVHGRVFPTVPVDNQSDLILSYDRGDFYRDEMQKLAPGTESEGTGFNVSDDNYFADVWALHKNIPDQTRENQTDPMSLEDDSAEFLAQKAMIRKEKQWASDYMTTGVWTTDLDGSGSDFTQWSDSSSTPIDDITSEMITQMELTGFKPNRLVLGPKTFNQLRNHPDIVDRVKHTSAESVTTAMIAQLIDIDMGDPLRVMVAGGVENTAAEGATDSFSFIVGKSALLAYAAPNPGLFRPSGGYTYAWNGRFGAGREGIRTLNFRVEKEHSDRVEIQVAFDFKLMAADMGTFFANAVA